MASFILSDNFTLQKAWGAAETSVHVIMRVGSPLPIAGIGSFATANISSCPSLSSKTYQFAVFVGPVVFLAYLFVLSTGLKKNKV